MSGDQTPDLVYLVLLLVLIGSGLVARRLPIRHSLKMLGGWALIFLIAFILFSLEDRIADLFGAVADERRAESVGARVGEELRISQAPDGHFWITAQVNGHAVRFLVDSGATTTSLSSATATAADVKVSGGFPVLVSTANGTVEVQRGRVERLQVGHIVREDVAVHVAEVFGDTDVLGMNFLSSLGGWRVEGRSLILTP